jgi:hypothetical protein
MSTKRVWSEQNFLGLRNFRKTNDPQLWIAGCSFADGAALTDKKQRWGQVLAKYLNCPASFLSRAGSSIDWIADQILRSDLKSGDTFIWALTGVNRVTWFDSDGNTLKLGPGLVAGAQYHTDVILSTKEKEFYTDLINNDALVYLSMRHVMQVVCYYKNKNVRLILAFHPELSLLDHSIKMVDFLKTFDCFIELTSQSQGHLEVSSKEKSFADLWKHRKYLDTSNNKQYIDQGHDHVHLGPLQHQQWANDIFGFIKSD